MDWDQCKISEFNLVQFTLLIFHMHKYHKYKSKCYNELSLTLIIPKGIPLLWPIPLPTIHPCLTTPPSFFFFFFKLCNSEIWFHSESHTHRDATFKWLTERATCQIRNSKSWGHSAYWKFPMVAWRGKWGKEEGKGERRMVDREQFPGCGHRAQTSHQHTIISKDAKHYWPNSTWLKSI